MATSTARRTVQRRGRDGRHDAGARIGLGYAVSSPARGLSPAGARGGVP